MSHSPWAKPVHSRDQRQMFSPTLDDLLTDDDEMRLFESLVEEIDWRGWEAKYDLRRGRPPVHPRLVAGVILFGLTKGLRSSRQLEDSTRKRIDMMWFLEGRTLDHSTICDFHQRFGEELKDLFEQLARRAGACAGKAAGAHVAVDGTRVRAHSDRHGARTARTLREKLDEVARQHAQLLDALARNDTREDAAEALAGTGCDESPEQLRRDLARLEAHEANLRKALAVAEQRDAVKRVKDGPRAAAVRVPVADPESTVLPNKEGGYAPNWTATVAVDVASGAIVSAEVVDGAEEAAALAPAVEATQRTYGRKPQALLADGNFPTGAALKELDEGQTPLLSPCPPAVQPAVLRPDLSKPVDSARHDDLPMRGKPHSATLAPQAFVYVQGQDLYYCPQGRALRRAQHVTRRDKNGQSIEHWRYRCDDCSNCPLAPRCLKGKAKRRTVNRSEYQPYRDQLARRMEHPQAQEIYKTRAPSAEGAFGHIKYAMGIRQFYRRGAQAVRREWRWICAAYNVGKILRHDGQNNERSKNGPPRPGKDRIRRLQSILRLLRARRPSWSACHIENAFRQATIHHLCA